MSAISLCLGAQLRVIAISSAVSFKLFSCSTLTCPVPRSSFTASTNPSRTATCNGYSSKSPAHAWFTSAFASSSTAIVDRQPQLVAATSAVLWCGALTLALAAMSILMVVVRPNCAAICSGVIPS